MTARAHNESIETEKAPPVDRSRRKEILTAEDWKRVERNVRSAEKNPDPQQLGIPGIAPIVKKSRGKRR
jgi:hypothetical protein